MTARDTIARALGVDDSRFDARVERGNPCRDGGVIVVMEVGMRCLPGKRQRIKNVGGERSNARPALT